MRIAADAYRFLIPLLAMAVAAAALSWTWLAAVAGVLFQFVLSFFRAPERNIPAEPNLIVSPADGRVVVVEQGIGGASSRVSIFLSIFNVHVNRAPIAGVVESVESRRGKFKAAFDDTASIENEQTVVEVVDGRQHVKVALIAGLIARRIVCRAKPGMRFERGERIGLIRFGSRVDLHMRGPVRVAVKKGDTVRGGASIIGIFEA